MNLIDLHVLGGSQVNKIGEVGFPAVFPILAPQAAGKPTNEIIKFDHFDSALGPKPIEPATPPFRCFRPSEGARTRDPSVGA